MTPRPRKLLDQVRACPELVETLEESAQGPRRTAPSDPTPLVALDMKEPGQKPRLHGYPEDWTNLEIDPVWFLPFQPRVLLFDHALIQLLEERRRRAQRVGIVFAQEAGHLHERAAALASLRTFEVEVFMVTMHTFLSP